MDEFIDYHWTKKGDLAVLNMPYSKPIYYNKESVESALNTVKANKDAYYTEIAYHRDLQMFQLGLSVFS